MFQYFVYRNGWVILAGINFEKIALSLYWGESNLTARMASIIGSHKLSLNW